VGANLTAGGRGGIIPLLRSEQKQVATWLQFRAILIQSDPYFGRVSHVRTSSL
jgi:hypothetical protein